MPFEIPLAAEGNPDALRNVESFHAPPDRISPSVHAQLTNPQDIASANQFFKPPAGGADQFLPTVGKVTPQGIELSAMAPGKLGAPPMTGLETQPFHLPTGGEAALAGAPGITPGAEQISPLINMIMKMPGHIGLVGSFFEALGAFFAPAQEMLGHLVEGFDPSALFEHAGAASEALGEAMEAAGGHMSADLSLLPHDAPIFEQMAHGGASDFSPGSFEGAGHGLEGGAPHLSDSFANAPKLEVGGTPDKPLFEQGVGAKDLSFEGPANHYLAMEPNRGFGATVGNFSPNNTLSHAAPTQPATSPTLASSRDHLLGDGAIHAHAAPPAAETGAANQFESQQPGQPVDQPTTAATDQTSEVQAESQPTTESYTVHRGDNLWDIARTHLGDGTRWQEIYDLNKNVLGDNPRMIMPGTELSIPGGTDIASGATGGADYTVQSGDNLWDISQQHMGGGQNWHDLYQNNEAVVGSNPDMIHPGQHLQLDGASHDAAAASPGASGDISGSGSGHHNLASAPHHVHNLAHHQPTHAHAHNSAIAEGSGAAAHNTAAAAHHPIATAHNAAGGPAVSHHGAAGGELKAQAQTLSSSSIQSYGDAVTHTVDTAAQVPNAQP